jgi:hypothetical protein
MWAKVFSCERHATAGAKMAEIVWYNPWTWWTGHYTYRTCFHAVFVVFGLVGFVLAVVLFCLGVASFLK